MCMYIYTKPECSSVAYTVSKTRLRMKHQTSRVFWSSTLLLLVILVNLAAAEYPRCESLHRPASCNKETDKKVDYPISVHCVSNTTVDISFYLPDELRSEIELITMQYSCYNGSERYTRVLSSESEMFDESYTVTDELFHEGAAGHCNVTGCTKKVRKQCWQFILNDPVSISCPEPPLRSSTFISTSAVDISQTAVAATESILFPLVITRTLASLSVTPGSQQSLVPSATIQSLPSYSPSTLTHLESPAAIPSPSVFITTVNEPTSADKLSSDSGNTPVLISVVATLMTLFGFTISFSILLCIGCKRVQKIRTTKFQHSDIERIHGDEIDQNIYIDNFNLQNLLQQEPNGSVLTLVQSVHINTEADYNSKQYSHSTLNNTTTFQQYNATSATEILGAGQCKWNEYATTTLDNSILKEPSNFTPVRQDSIQGRFSYPLKNSVLNSSCPSLPECTELTTANELRKNLLHSSCMNIPVHIKNYVNTTTSEDQSECQSTLENDVFTEGPVDDPSCSLPPATTAQQYKLKLIRTATTGSDSTTTESTLCSSSSSGYISLSATQQQ